MLIININSCSHLLQDFIIFIDKQVFPFLFLQQVERVGRWRHLSFTADNSS